MKEAWEASEEEYRAAKEEQDEQNQNASKDSELTAQGIYRMTPHLTTHGNRAGACTHARRVCDKNAVDLRMGLKNQSTGDIYNSITWDED